MKHNRLYQALLILLILGGSGKISGQVNPDGSIATIDSVRRDTSRVYALSEKKYAIGFALMPSYSYRSASSSIHQNEIAAFRFEAGIRFQYYFSPGIRFEIGGTYGAKGYNEKLHLEDTILHRLTGDYTARTSYNFITVPLTLHFRMTGRNDTTSQLWLGGGITNGFLQTISTITPSINGAEIDNSEEKLSAQDLSDRQIATYYPALLLQADLIVPLDNTVRIQVSPYYERQLTSYTSGLNPNSGAAYLWNIGISLGMTFAFK